MFANAIDKLPDEDRRGNLELSGRSFLLERIPPPQPRESCEITIGSVQHSPIFDRKGCDLSITDERTKGLSLDHYPP